MNISVNTAGVFIIFIIVTILLTALVTTFILIRKYTLLKKELRNEELRRAGIFNSTTLNDIVSDFKRSYSLKTEINTQAIIENHFSANYGTELFGERFLKHGVSLMIILGLMGTFFGLTLSISGLGDIMTGDLDGIVENLTVSLGGMEVAFNTSLVGIGCSVILTITKILFSVENMRMDVYVLIEDYLDNTVANSIAKNTDDQYEMIVTSMEKIFTTFGANITDKFYEIVDTSTNKMVYATKGIEDASKELSSSIERFDESINTFVENTRDFAEFNHHLKSNISRMSLAFSDFTDDIKEVNKKSEV